MVKWWIAVLLVTCVGCRSKTTPKANDTTKVKPSTGSNYSKKAVDSLVRVGAISPDSLPDPPPTQAEEKQRLLKAYDDVKVTDSIFFIDSDTIHFQIKDYYLKNVNLVIPKFYDEDQKNPKDFVTHPFVADILLIKGRDTLLKKQFGARDFYPFFKDPFGGNLKKYGSIVDPHLSRNNKDKNHIEVWFSISIPTTDLGLGMSLTIDKKGNYEIQAPYQK